jgi:hypothetical protein
MSKGTPNEPSKYKRRGRMLTNAEHSKVVEKQIRYQNRKASKKTA